MFQSWPNPIGQPNSRYLISSFYDMLCKQFSLSSPSLVCPFVCLSQNGSKKVSILPDNNLPYCRRTLPYLPNSGSFPPTHLPSLPLLLLCCCRINLCDVSMANNSKFMESVRHEISLDSPKWRLLHLSNSCKSLINKTKVPHYQCCSISW